MRFEYALKMTSFGRGDRLRTPLRRDTSRESRSPAWPGLGPRRAVDFLFQEIIIQPGEHLPQFGPADQQLILKAVAPTAAQSRIVFQQLLQDVPRRPEIVRQLPPVELQPFRVLVLPVPAKAYTLRRSLRSSAVTTSWVMQSLLS